MNFRKIATLAGFIIVVSTLIAYAEEPSAAPADSTSASVDQQVAPKDVNETQWAWGEVMNLDAQAKTLTLKHLDYETDQEKDIILAVNEKTTFENIKSFDEIKIKDTLSIDYIVGPDGKNIAKNINFEKPDSSAATAVPATESTKPAEIAVQPVIVPSAQVVAPAETPAPAAVPAPVPAPEVAQSTAQPGTTTESSAPASSEAPAQPASAPATQQSQSY